METENKEEIEQIDKPKDTKFTKENILNSKKYSKQKDLINALLKNDTTYTLKEVDALINKYLKGVVK